MTEKSLYRGVGIIRKGIIRKALELSGKRWNYPEKNLPVQNMGIIRKKSCFVEKSENSTKTSFRLELYGVKNENQTKPIKQPVYNLRYKVEHDKKC